MTPRTIEKRLPLTPEQVQLLNETERATQIAVGRMDLLLAGILAGHGIRGGTFKGMEPGDPAHLVVVVPIVGLVGSNGDNPAPVAESPPEAASP